MANWCITDYVFYADSDEAEKQLILFHKILEDSISSDIKHLFNTDFGDTWLGNVIQAFTPQYMGVTTSSVVCHYNDDEIRFRGSITYTDFDEKDPSEYHISTETAWGPMYKMWDMILADPRFNKIKYVLESEEPGNGLYINSDRKGRFFNDRYHAEINFPLSHLEYCTEYFSSAKELLYWLNNIIEDIRTEYTTHPEHFCLPMHYNPKILKKQKSAKAAISLITDNLFRIISDTEGYKEPYLAVNKYEY